ncbi:MAG: hypothetical protein II235_01270 [Muribaculaceae bacterium]|nr:hypothetical protein [Muribaculaceae bacterium]MEE1297713.1 hypothetical protein [Muribaculaceae bacterium]
MKRKLSLLLAAFAVSIGSTLCYAANEVYKVLDVRGSVIVNDNMIALAKGQTLKGSDVLLSDRLSIVKLSKETKALTLRVNGKHTVQELIDKIPNKYETAISVLQKSLKKAKKANVVYGVVTMANEFDNFELNENEAYVHCQEDTLGNLNVAFMRHGMEKPQMYTLDANAYIYLLKMAILSAQGYNYAYEAETSYIYQILWKPLEKFFKPGDTILISLPESLSVFDMNEIPLNSELKMSDVYVIYDMNATE